MTLLHTNAPRRDPSLRAGASRVALVSRIITAIRRVIPARGRYDALPPLSDHLARDIGLDAADLAASRHRFPSQSTFHPRG
ncbi:hypothetical protein [uncultured Roseobacter sp.]|uniref:hypothetical protein n=1 Tax=uncultured Roseobacter sp. TaxID=114847 RepID=UPI00260B96C3|nr:hypothetical protein [uncultured Roseobacter sp.]